MGHYYGLITFALIVALYALNIYQPLVSVTTFRWIILFVFIASVVFEFAAGVKRYMHEIRSRHH